MKNNLRLPFLFTVALALTPPTLQASDNFENGDLAVVFYSATGSGPTLALGPQYFVFNLGPASLFRENTANDVPVSSVNPLINGNVATDLAAVFGSTWASDGTVRMFVTSTISSTQSLVNGDPAVTIYSSVPRTSLNNGAQGAGVSFPSYSFSSTRNNSSGAISSFIYSGTNPAIAQSGGYTNSNPTVAPFGNPAGVRLPMTGNLINLSDFVPPKTGSSLYFAIGTNPAATFGTGTLSGSAGVEGAVSMFRVLHSLADTNSVPADLTTGSASGNAVVGTPQYIGSLSIDSSGLLKVQAVGVAAAGNYASFATANGLTGGPNGDSDFDGIKNLTEYALNLNTAGSDGSPGTFSDGLISFSKRAAAVTNGDVTYAIQESDDLGITDPWQTVTPTSNTTSAITYLLPTGSPKKFTRLLTSIP